jgi:protein MpaA
VALPLLAAPVSGATTPTASTATTTGTIDTVVERRVIGHSVRGRPIVAYRLGRPTNRDKAVVLSTMHGDEPHTRRILTSLRDGRPIRGIDVWVVPVVNPDGLARGTRKNAHGVDLNRNFPYSWRDLDGRYESGPRPASEPETRALIAFLRDVGPRWIVSFHQPLYSVDTDTKIRWMANRLAEELHLPRSSLDCGGVCHGTMTGWYNHNFAGGAVTVEYGAHPTRERMTVYAPRQLLRALGAERYTP